MLLVSQQPGKSSWWYNNHILRGFRFNFFFVNFNIFISLTPFVLPCQVICCPQDGISPAPIPSMMDANECESEIPIHWFLLSISNNQIKMKIFFRELSCMHSFREEREESNHLVLPKNLDIAQNFTDYIRAGEVCNESIKNFGWFSSGLLWPLQIYATINYSPLFLERVLYQVRMSKPSYITSNDHQFFPNSLQVFL